jgi:endogenous inhibitor of DNA gyrase (YacG/DUF329 family)
VAEPLCVFCRRLPVDLDWRPFCSERCRLQDLARWADGSYAIRGDAVKPADPAVPVQPEGESDGGPAAGPAGPEELNPETARPTRNLRDR